MRVHIDPKLGRIPLKRLQAPQVQRFYAGLLESGSSPKTVRNIHVVLHRALDQAVRWRLTPVNVADLVDPPQPQQHEMTALSAEEAQQVLIAARGDDLEALWWLALTAGMRQGELLGLRWLNVDLDNATVQVVASSVRLVKQARVLVGWGDGEDQRLGEPKSRRSRRKIELSSAAVEALRRHRHELMETALRTGRPFDRNGFVFAREDGQPLAVTTTWKLWGRLLKKAGVPYVRFHDARHTAATLLLSKGVHPKVVSGIFGS